jgi:acyl carrier protein
VNQKNQDLSPGHRVVAVIQHVFDERSITRPICVDDNLMEVGLTSLDTVKLVLLVESEFDLMIPISDITPANFQSISAISRLITRLLRNT